MTNIISAEKQARRFSAHLWAAQAHDIVPASGLPNQSSFYDTNVGGLNVEPRLKHTYVFYYNAAATGAVPVRVPMTPGTYTRASEIAVALNLASLSSEATSWRPVLFAPEEVPPAVTQEVSASQRRVSRLLSIQATLGLPVQTLATILRISRPALYKWLDVDDEVQPHADNRERLIAVERIAQKWRVRSSSPLNSVAYEPLANGRTIIDMLTAGDINESDIFRSLDELVAKLQAKPNSLSQRMMEAGYSRRPSRRAIADDE